MTEVKLPSSEFANCVSIGVDAFYTYTDNSSTKSRYVDLDEAKLVCESCSIREECLTWALHHEVYGIWGGTTPPQREKMRKKLGIKYKPLEY